MVAVGLICIATAQEVLYFPIGPAHNADTWRINARLGVGCFGAQAWSSKIPYPGRYVILLTRCTDKSAPLTSVSLSRAIEEFEHQGFKSPTRSFIQENEDLAQLKSWEIVLT